MATETNYNVNAQDYQANLKTLPLDDHVNDPSYFQLIGDLNGKSVLDVGCGDGRLTRMLRLAGAERVVGIDVSFKMIELARQVEALEPIGIDYQIEDAKTICKPEFDVVVSSLMLAHAQTRSDLEQMCRGLASHLKPGGRLVSLNVHPKIADYPAFNYKKYGLEYEFPVQFVDGAPFACTVRIGNSHLTFHDYWYSMETMESALGQAGFREISWHQVKPFPAASTDETDYWDDLLAHPVDILLDCKLEA